MLTFLKMELRLGRRDVKSSHAKRVCHHCGQQLEIPDSAVGEPFPCPACGKDIMSPPDSVLHREKITLTVLPPPVENYSAPRIAQIARQIIANVQTVIVGKEPQVTLAVAGLFAEGHIYLKMFRALRRRCCRAPSRRASAARSSESNARRICSRKMSSVNSSSTRLRAGRISVSARCSRKWFLVDEINRASPRTQAAMLEAMGEGMVSMDKVSYRLEKPFMVMATQNPIEQEGHFDCPKRKWIVFFALEPRLS